MKARTVAGRGKKSLLCDPGSELRDGRREGRRWAKIIKGMSKIYIYIYIYILYIQHHGRCRRSAPPRVEVVSGLVLQDNFMPSRRFREDGLEDLELPTGGGARVNTLVGAPAVAKQTKPCNSDSLQVQVKPVLFTL